ncbi:YqaJ viral recombinase family protein [Mesorhizobium sp. M1409]|uniref:YqaJ viral recombinase family nuclease n=1 Tax=Mesorhizobium sp. M1409 TaxID=2957100 RepID=UPI00333C60DD
MIERVEIIDRAAWLAMRANDLTASDIGAAIGIDPFKSQLALYAEKTGLLLPAGDNVMMRRGRWFEPAVVEAIRDAHPDWEVRYPLKRYLRDPETRLGCTPDAIAATDQPGLTNIQLKVIARPEFERRWSDGPPLHYRLQTLCEGMLMDVERSMLAVLVIDAYSAELEEFEVPRHAAAEKRLVEIAKRFWNNVATGKRPAADVTRDAETVAAIYPQSVKEPVLDLSHDNRMPALLNERAALKAEVDTATIRVGQIETEIKAKLGEAERAELPGWRISWKTQTRQAHLVPEATFRALRVTEVKAKEEAA